MATPSELSPSAPAAHHRAEQSRARRYEPTPLYVLAEHLKREGVELSSGKGPWQSVRRRLRRPGRNAEQTIPIVTNGVVEIAVDTAEHAVDLAGFLNAADIHHLDPVPNLRPPHHDLVDT